VPLGMTLEYVLADDANDALTEGTAIRIRANHRAIGPVTDTEPLEVLGQTVQVTTETRGLTEQQSADLAVGDIVKVDGHVDADGVIRATRLVNPDAVSQWQLMGRIDKGSLDSGSFKVRNQKVDYGSNGVIPDCSLSAGTRVIVRATTDNAFFGDDVLDSVEAVQCLSEGLSLFGIPDANGPDVPPQLPAAYEGIVTSILTEAIDLNNLAQTLQDLKQSDTPLLTLSLNGQKVGIPLDNLPELLSGTLADLLKNLSIGVKIEVQGALDTETGVLMADKIRFQDPIVSLSGPLLDLNGTARLLGHTVESTLGSLEGTLTSLPGSKVRVRGFISEGGRVYAQSVDSFSALDPNYPGEEMRAPVERIDQQQKRLFLGDTSVDLASTGTVKFLEGSLLLNTVETVIEITTNITCELLSLFSLRCDSPEPIEWPEDSHGAVAEIEGSSWDDGFSSGTLKVRQVGR
jgi:hypothetical protein